MGQLRQYEIEALAKAIEEKAKKKREEIIEVYKTSDEYAIAVSQEMNTEEFNAKLQVQNLLRERGILDAEIDRLRNIYEPKSYRSTYSIETDEKLDEKVAELRTDAEEKAVSKRVPEVPKYEVIFQKVILKGLDGDTDDLITSLVEEIFNGDA